MKNAPFLLSSLLALTAVILSLVSFGSGQSNNSLQSDLLRKQTEFQDLQSEVTMKNQDSQRQGEIINSWNNLAKNIAQPILVEMGFRAAKNKNDKLKNAMRDLKWGDAIPTEEKLKEMEKEIEKNNKAKQGGAAPAPAPAPSTSAVPAVRPN